MEQSVEPEENEKVVADEKLVLVVEAYKLDNKTLHNDLMQNEIVVVVAEELILDSKGFRQCSKYSKNTK